MAVGGRIPTPVSDSKWVSCEACGYVIERTTVACPNCGWVRQTAKKKDEPDGH